ncbi:hypothetical protein GUJ93_ZPchr0008g13746 [Zizania palustris]|uniref:Retrotransposon protein n=1 Tax=Zizania palustris TaxID=103762 RepID=A0A8J5QZI5_ZIZPA|nr:hypothetical protein GUJ93_ZPchr0008g13746 [Zizania palustris]
MIQPEVQQEGESNSGGGTIVDHVHVPTSGISHVGPPISNEGEEEYIDNDGDVSNNSEHEDMQAVLQPPLAAASDRLRPHRCHRRDRRRPPDLGHASVGQEDRRIAIAVEHPNLSIVYPHRLPRSVNRSPRLRYGVFQTEGTIWRWVKQHLRVACTDVAQKGMPVYQVHSYWRHFEGFVRELRMMLTFLGFLFEPEFQGVYLEEFVGPCDVSLTVHGSGEHLPPYTTALGGPTFDVACQRVALQALMELRMIYDDRLQNSSFWLVPKRTPGAYHSIYLGVHSVRDPVMARQSRLLHAMDDLHTEAVLDADEHHEAVEFLREETKNLIQQNGEL